MAGVELILEIAWTRQLELLLGNSIFKIHQNTIRTINASLLQHRWIISRDI